jgi:hypothetical protein
LLRCSATGAHRAWLASATPTGMRLIELRIDVDRDLKRQLTA